MLKPNAGPCFTVSWAKASSTPDSPIMPKCSVHHVDRDHTHAATDRTHEHREREREKLYCTVEYCGEGGEIM